MIKCQEQARNGRKKSGSGRGNLTVLINQVAYPWAISKVYVCDHTSETGIMTTLNSEILRSQLIEMNYKVLAMPWWRAKNISNL